MRSTICRSSLALPSGLKQGLFDDACRCSCNAGYADGQVPHLGLRQWLAVPLPVTKEKKKPHLPEDSQDLLSLRCYAVEVCRNSEWTPPPILKTTEASVQSTIEPQYPAKVAELPALLQTYTLPERSSPKHLWLSSFESMRSTSI